MFRQQKRHILLSPVKTRRLEIRKGGFLPNEEFIKTPI